MKFGPWNLDDGIVLIAEIGNNHEGNLERAHELVREAAAAGATAVKFQTFRTEQFIRSADRERFEKLKSFELRPEDFSALSTLARSLGLFFISTPLDLDSAKVLQPLVDVYKVASGDITFKPLIEFLASTGKPVIISTGASELPEIKAVVDTFRGKDLALLHCVSAYPTPAAETNLLSIRILQNHFPGLPVGYSDHAIGIEACIAGAAAGAVIIEKHFTLDKTLSTHPDHQLSADPVDLDRLSKGLRQVHAMLGRNAKAIQPCEETMRLRIRRSIALRQALPAGHRLRWEDLVWLRPGSGMAPGRENEVVGRILRKDGEAGQLLDLNDLENL